MRMALFLQDGLVVKNLTQYLPAEYSELLVSTDSALMMQRGRRAAQKRGAVCKKITRWCGSLAVHGCDAAVVIWRGNSRYLRDIMAHAARMGKPCVIFTLAFGK